MPKITNSLWFDTQAEEAAKFYVSVFPNSKIGRVTYWSEATPDAAGVDKSRVGTVLTVEFELDGHPFLGLNAGPVFKFSEAISFAIDCADQAEVDRYWDALREGGGEESQCGWLKDRFGLSWQVVPRRLMELQADPDAAKRKRVNEAMFKMRKLDIAALEAAARG